MRLLASLHHYVLLAGDHGLALHQYVPGVYAATSVAGEAEIEVGTDYPWSGVVSVRVLAAPGSAWELALRIPEWARHPSVSINGEQVESEPIEGWLRTERRWTAGDEIILELPLSPRFTQGDPRLDAARASVAIEYGPLVYCVESADNPSVRLDDVSVDPLSAPTVDPPATAGELGDAVTITVGGRISRHRRDQWWPYRPFADSDEGPRPSITLTAIPYYTWGNRGPGAMRVWLPTA